jgi:hypothetical protein
MLFGFFSLYALSGPIRIVSRRWFGKGESALARVLEPQPQLRDLDSDKESPV